MTRDSRFWTLLLVFQVGFGFLVFAVTRDYYVQEENGKSPHALPSGQVATAWPNGIAANEIARLTSSEPNQFLIQDPVEIARQANAYFADRQYEQAAKMYERLLTFNPNDAEIYNNLGLTLHYLGRSAEALQRLEEGTTADPGHQRIWLTTGFVNRALGNIDQARLAFTNATSLGDDESVRQSAQKMLDDLP